MTWKELVARRKQVDKINIQHVYQELMAQGRLQEASKLKKYIK